jgi:hypothetical protein
LAIGSDRAKLTTGSTTAALNGRLGGHQRKSLRGARENSFAEIATTLSAIAAIGGLVLGAGSNRSSTIA